MRTWPGRIALVLAAVLAFSLGVPPEAAPRGSISLDWLERLLSIRLAWGAPADPDTPEQGRGRPADWNHRATTAQSRAEGGTGRPRGQGVGELPADEPITVPPPEEHTTPPAGRFDAATSRRNAERSAESMDFYENADGSVTQILTAGRVNYRTPDGRWERIDTRLVPRQARDSAAAAPSGDRSSGDRSQPAADDVRLETAANDIVVSLAGPARVDRPAGAQGGAGAQSGAREPGAGVDGELASWQELASVTLPTGEVFAYRLQGARPVRPTVSGSTATYQNVLPNTDIELQAEADGLKETIVLHSPEAATSWVFPLRLSGLTPSIDIDGGVSLTNEAGEVVGWIPQGSMSDSRFDRESGEFTTSAAVRYELIEVDGGPALRVTADESWVRDPARVFPIRVDPTLTIITDGDIFVDNDDNGPPHNGDNLPVGTFNGGGYKARSFLRFRDFSAVVGARITSAKLHLYHTWSYDCNHHYPVTIRQVTGSWSIASLNTLPASEYPGPSLGSTVGELLIQDNYPACLNENANRTVGAWRTATLSTDLFNGWSAGTISNRGLALTASESNSYAWKRFTSAAVSSGQYAPKLELTWTPNVAPQVNGMYPSAGYAAGTLTPELVVEASDPDNFPQALKFKFLVYDKNMTEIANSGWITQPRWRVTAGKLSWATRTCGGPSSRTGSSKGAAPSRRSPCGCPNHPSRPTCPRTGDSASRHR
jgi:hypothetical protein